MYYTLIGGINMAKKAAEKVEKTEKVVKESKSECNCKCECNNSEIANYVKYS